MILKKLLNRSQKFVTNKKAFSLIELSIVILIVGIIIAGITQSSSLVRKMRLSSARSLTNSSPVPGISGLTYWIESVGTQSFATGSAGNFTNSELLDENQSIGRWNDINPQSTNKINVSQSILARQPTYASSGINNLPAVQFNSGQNDCLLSPPINGGSIATLNEVTLFVVQQFQGNLATDNTSVIWVGDGTGGDRVINLHSPEGGFVRFDSGNYIDNYRVSFAAPAGLNSSQYIMAGIRNNSTSRLFLNGLNVATISNGGTSKIDLSTAYTLNIGCIINTIITLTA